MHLRYYQLVLLFACWFPLQVWAHIPYPFRKGMESTGDTTYSSYAFDKVSRTHFFKKKWSWCIYSNLHNMLFEFAEKGIKGIIGYTYDQLSPKQHWSEPGNIGYWLSKQPYGKGLSIHIGCIPTREINSSEDSNLEEERKQKAQKLQNGYHKRDFQGCETSYPGITTKEIATLVEQGFIGILDDTKYTYSIMDVREGKNDKKEFKILDAHERGVNDCYWVSEDVFRLKLCADYNYFVFAGPKNDSLDKRTLIRKDSFIITDEDMFTPCLDPQGEGVAIPAKKPKVESIPDKKQKNEVSIEDTHDSIIDGMPIPNHEGNIDLLTRSSSGISGKPNGLQSKQVSKDPQNNAYIKWGIIGGLCIISVGILGYMIDRRYAKRLTNKQQPRNKETKRVLVV